MILKRGGASFGMSYGSICSRIFPIYMLGQVTLFSLYFLKLDISSYMSVYYVYYWLRYAWIIFLELPFKYNFFILQSELYSYEFTVFSTRSFNTYLFLAFSFIFKNFSCNVTFHNFSLFAFFSVFSLTCSRLTAHNQYRLVFLYV